jgi:hypothetical protein
MNVLFVRYRIRKKLKGMNVLCAVGKKERWLGVSKREGERFSERLSTVFERHERTLCTAGEKGKCV